MSVRSAFDFLANIGPEMVFTRSSLSPSPECSDANQNAVETGRHFGDLGP
jgi:hypothetical protein